MAHKIINMLNYLNETGCTPEEIKESVFQVLESYFENKESLKEHLLSADILSAFEYFIRYHYEDCFFDGLKEVLALYRGAYSAEPKKTLDIILSPLDTFISNQNKMFTIRQYEPELGSSDLYDSVISLFEHVGAILEINTKGIICELYVMYLCYTHKPYDYSKIQTYNFGTLINNLLDKNYFHDILITSPINIKLSDWRNIAYHHTYFIEDEKIICKYGKNGASFAIDYNELTAYAHKIVRTSNIFSIAQCIFEIDIFDEIESYGKTSRDFSGNSFRISLLLQRLKISIASQGFYLHECCENKDTLDVVIWDLRNNGDLTKEKVLERKIHSSQFLYEFWCIYRKEHIQIKYCNKQGIPLFQSSVRGEVCKYIFDNHPDISHMVQYVEFINL